MITVGEGYAARLQPEKPTSSPLSLPNTQEAGKRSQPGDAHFSESQ
jgi:hypothetical protein